MRISVTADPFDPGAELTRFSNADAGTGAIVTFSGVVRDTDTGLKVMEIEHYPGMTEKALSAIAEEAVERWSLNDCLVIHRHGPLAVGEVIMMVATAAPHRSDAFAAAEYLMDYLKSRAPFWKKEVSAEGSSWVAAKDEDEDALARWRNQD